MKRDTDQFNERIGKLEYKMEAINPYEVDLRKIESKIGLVNVIFSQIASQSIVVSECIILFSEEVFAFG